MASRVIRPDDDLEWILIHVEPGTPLQTANHGRDELVVYAYGTPPEDEQAEILDSAL